jgi:phospholipase/carboxylesterase
VIDGPRLSPASGETRKLVILLHGYGADGHDLFDLGRQLAPVLPDTAFVSPDAPYPCGEAPMGREWFPLVRRDPEAVWQGARSAAAELDGFLDAERDRLGLADGDLALLGFSQGTMMALHVGLRRAAALAGIVGFSGFLPGAEHLRGQIRQKPPVLLIHGSDDPLIPPGAMAFSANALAAAGVPVEQHLVPGLGHGIDSTGLTLAARFLRRVLA